MAGDLRDVISQYAESPNLKAYILVFVNEAREACDSIQELIDIFNLDTAVGEHLDLIGRIIGQFDRPWYDTSDIPWFSFGDGSAGDDLLFGFNEGRLWDGRTINPGGPSDFYKAEDDIYRMFIKARIVHNTSKGTVNNLLTAIEVVTERTDIKVLGSNGEEGGMQIKIHGDTIPVGEFEKTFILGYDLLPIPAGVKLIEVI